MEKSNLKNLFFNQPYTISYRSFVVFSFKSTGRLKYKEVIQLYAELYEEFVKKLAQQKRYIFKTNRDLIYSF